MWLVCGFCSGHLRSTLRRPQTYRRAPLAHSTHTPSPPPTPLQRPPQRLSERPIFPSVNNLSAARAFVSVLGVCLWEHLTSLEACRVLFHVKHDKLQLSTIFYLTVLGKYPIYDLPTKTRSRTSRSCSLTTEEQHSPSFRGVA